MSIGANIFKLWKTKGQILEGITNSIFKREDVEAVAEYRMFVCKNCGNMATVNPEKNIFSCKNCKNITNFAEVRIPYACKLLFQEIQTMGIGAKFITAGAPAAPPY